MKRQDQRMSSVPRVPVEETKFTEVVGTVQFVSKVV